jgi:DNA gyrase subunit A
LRPMGRNAAGNKGISLKKGDYVIGAAITDSDESRDKQRDECAKTRGLTDKLT